VKLIEYLRCLFRPGASAVEREAQEQALTEHGELAMRVAAHDRERREAYIKATTAVVAKTIVAKMREADSRAKLRQPAPAARFTRRKDDEPRDTMAGTYLDPTNPLSFTGSPIYSSSSDPSPSCDSGSSSSSGSGDSSSCGSSGGDW